MKKNLYSEKQPHVDYYEEGCVEKILENSKMKAYDYMFLKNQGNDDLTAFNYYNNKITYKEMFENIEKYANMLKNYGIKKGDIVSLIMPTMPEIVYLKYALNRIGATSYLIDPRTNPERMLGYINNSNSKLVVAPTEIIDSKLSGIANEIKCKNILTVSVGNSMSFMASSLKGKAIYLMIQLNKLKNNIKYKIDKGSKFISIDKMKKEFGSKVNKNLDTPYEEDQPFAIYTTSGTTDPSGVLKGCVETNEAYNAMVEEMYFAGKDFLKGESFLGIIPFFSSYGSVNGMHNSLCCGWEIIMLTKFNTNDFDILLTKYKPNNALGVPRFWETIIRNNRVNDEDFSFLKRAVAGGDKININVVNEINEFFKSHGSKTVLKIGYGASEFGGCVSATYEDYDIYKPDTAGLLLPACKAMVIDPETKIELNIGEVGEICINSPTMIKEYFNNREATEAMTVIKDGVKYYKTGDKGSLDESGHVHIIDRYKRVIKTPDGHSVHASPIEGVIMQHPSVESCVAVGLAYKDQVGTIPTVFIKLKNQDKPFSDVVKELNSLCLQKLPEGDKPHAFSEVENLEFTLMVKPNHTFYEKLRFEDVETIIVDNQYLEPAKTLKR